MSITDLATAQNIGYMSPGRAPGSPAGSVALSDFETINPYSGNLNVSLSLLNIGGRGDAGYSVRRSINTKWNVYQQWSWDGGYSTYHPYANTAEASIYAERPYSPGKVEIKFEREGSGCNPGEGGSYSELKRVVFTRPDGTVHDFVDQQTGGQPSFRHCGGVGPDVNRGRVFVTYDGSFITFVSDSQVTDYTLSFATGYLLFPDGTRYRVENEKIVWILDRNGNLTTFTYTTVYIGSYPTLRVASIKDSLGREVTFAYNIQDAGQYGVHDLISYKGTGGATREIRISYKPFRDVLRYDQTLQSVAQLFGHGSGDQSGGALMVSAIWMPNGQSYKLFYNSYVELARVELPTGGAYEYDWGATLAGGYPNGLIDVNGGMPSHPAIDIRRSVLEKRIYPDGGSGNSFETKITFSQTVGQETAASDRTIKTFDLNGNLLSQQKHYFHGNPVPSYHRHPFQRPPWNEGLEFKTENFDVVNNSPVLLHRIDKTWQSNGYGNARLIETVTTLIDTNQVTKTTSISPIDGSIGFDQFNNPTDVWEYDFGNGQPGSLLRRTHTDYVTDGNYTSHFGPYLRNLPLQTWISSDAAGANSVSLTQFEYDNYGQYQPDDNHASLVNRANVVGHDPSYGQLSYVRGNLTAVTTFANAQAQTEAVSAYSQYDVLGNVVTTIDAKGYASTISYDDNFGTADGEARTNTAPAQLNGQNTFAFPTRSTNALGWITGYSQVDYFTGASVNTENINGVISQTIHNDPFDRVTLAVSAIGTAFERQLNIVYDDANRRIETKGDLFALNDNFIKSESFYDGLGRTFESRSYKDGGYVVSKSEFDALGRVKQVSNPYRPDRSETAVWTKSKYDALGRAIEIETPDGAKAFTAFHGNRTLVTDQAGKQRISKTNALGQLKDVWEVTAADQWTEPISFPGQTLSAGYRTSYIYDTLNNLTTVNQGVQTRTFQYDSLSRLKLAANPESGTIEYLYDPNGNLIRKEDARHVVTEYVYDELNRVTNRNYSVDGATPPNYQPSPNVIYAYDNLPNAKGKLIKVTTGSGATPQAVTEYREFDALGRVKKSQQWVEGTAYGSPMTYTYNLSGALIEQTYPSGRVVKNTLDSNGELEMVQSKKNQNFGFHTYANNFTYNSEGAITSMQLGNGRWESTQFNSRLQPTQIALGTVQNGNDKLKLDYSYGSTQNNGNVISQTITVPTVGANPGFVATQNYTYDSLNRLKQANETIPNQIGWQQTFVYDRYGNRRFDTTPNATTTLDPNCPVAVCNPDINPTNNRLIGYEFDASGNTKTDAENRSFIYDSENKQVQVNNGPAIVGQYFYNGDGLRIKKGVPGGETTIFVYDAASRLVAEYSTTVEPQATGKTSYLTNDHLGSPRINTDAIGTVMARHDYHPFGEEIARTGYGSDTIRKQFTGYERDEETELDYAKARMFGYSIGRFTSPDALMASAKRIIPQSWNRYAYVLNNPLNYIDPSGMIWGRQWNGKDWNFVWFEGNKVPKGWTVVPTGSVVTNRDGNDVILGDRGRIEPAVPVDVPGVGRSWLSKKDADAINQITGGALCSLTAGAVCLNKGEPIADNVAAAGDAVQAAFLIKSLLASGVSLAVIAMAVRKNPDDIAKMAARVIGEGCFKNGDCKPAAAALIKEFEKNGIKGTLVRLKSPNGEALVKAGDYSQEIAAANSEGHFGVLVGDKVYEMYSTKGIPVSKWAKSYEYAPASSPSRVANPILEVVPPQ